MSETDATSTGIRALSRVGDCIPAPDHSVFWGSWFRTLVESRPRLTESEGDAGATHAFSSVGGAQIGCRLAEPEGEPRAGVVVLHGYHPTRDLSRECSRWRWASQLGLSVLHLRVRGFPGSARTTGDLTAPDERGLGWIARGFDDPGDAVEGMSRWVVPQAAADVANACRVMRNHLAGLDAGEPGRPLNDKRPLFLVGESLGGALAVIAAAQLSGRLAREDVIDRLVIGMPTLADWAWRLSHPPAGSGAEIARALESGSPARDAMLVRLKLIDTAVHAGRVRTPTLCKLALHDDVVPAPTAAAVFNALATSPGQKWRFVVPEGHAEGDLANTRRHALFERCMRAFLDPARDPGDSMEPWEELMLRGDHPPPAHSDAGAGGPQGALFDTGAGSDRIDGALIEAYEGAGRTLDALPYTPEFESMHAALVRTLGVSAPDRRSAFHRLHNLRKAGRLPRLGRSEVSVPKISSDDEGLLRRLVEGAAGSLGARDRLVYSPEFDSLVERFNAEAGHTLSNHDAWRLIARLAK